MWISFTRHAPQFNVWLRDFLLTRSNSLSVSPLPLLSSLLSLSLLYIYTWFNRPQAFLCRQRTARGNGACFGTRNTRETRETWFSRVINPLVLIGELCRELISILWDTTCNSISWIYRIRRDISTLHDRHSSFEKRSKIAYCDL